MRVSYVLTTSDFYDDFHYVVRQVHDLVELCNPAIQSCSAGLPTLKTKSL